MSANIDPKHIPSPSKWDIRQLEKDIAYFENAARETPSDRLGLVAFGISAGLKMATNELIARLKDHDISPHHGGCADCYGTVMDEAAEEIERLQTEHRETLQTLLGLINSLHGGLDRQTYDNRVKENFDAPRDAEYAVNVTAQQERDLTQAIMILEQRLRS